MKNIRFLTFVLILGTLILSACGAAAATPTSVPDAATAAKVDAMPVEFIGIVDSIAGDQWVISGTTVTVDESIVRDGPFQVGDQVKVQGFVNPDGSFTVSRVELPTPQETATLPPLSDNSNESLGNSNTNDANINDGNSNDSNTNDDNGGGNTNDDNSNNGNTNDDNGGNSNDDSGGGNTNDDNGGGNTNDDNGGDNSNDDNGNGG
ncbi:MAG TPA: DUF5666 domain-containing protein [Anaerolineales bacterium]|nr:DUF5666 domain-containing protein [Anaerolineales bacterium]